MSACLKGAFNSWLLLVIFVLLALALNGLMANNHANIVGVDGMFVSAQEDLPDARYWLINTDHLWTRQEIRDWIESKSEAQLAEYTVHNQAAFFVFLVFACVQWSLASLCLSDEQKWPLDYLMHVPFAYMAVKLIEVTCIHILMATYANGSLTFESLNLNTIALIGSFCTAAKLWLFLSWFPVFMGAAGISVWRRFSKTQFR